MGAEEVQVFDWERMFIGDASWLFLFEIVFRTAFIFMYTLLLVRVMGKRGMGQLAPFELVIIIALGSAVGDPMFYADVPLLHAMAVVTVIVVLQRLVALASHRQRRFENFLESQSTRLVADGVIEMKAMQAERFGRDELFMTLREEGIEQLGQVKRAFLEPSGRISAWLFPPAEVLDGLPLLPEGDEDCPPVFAAEESAPELGAYACVACGEVADFEAGVILPRCPTCDTTEGWMQTSDAGSKQAGEDDDSGSTPRQGRRRRRRRGRFGG